jgi:formylglycine-generating enzyme
MRVAREPLLLLARPSRLAPAQLDAVGSIMARSPVLGQGNPRISVHPIGRGECLAASLRSPLRPGDPACGMPRMVPLYDPRRETAADARVCIDQFEFPDVRCEYPVVHVSAHTCRCVETSSAAPRAMAPPR